MNTKYCRKFFPLFSCSLFLTTSLDVSLHPGTMLRFSSHSLCQRQVSEEHRKEKKWKAGLSLLIFSCQRYFHFPSAILLHHPSAYNESLCISWPFQLFHLKQWICLVCFPQEKDWLVTPPIQHAASWVYQRILALWQLILTSGGWDGLAV